MTIEQQILAVRAMSDADAARLINAVMTKVDVRIVDIDGHVDSVIGPAVVRNDSIVVVSYGAPKQCDWIDIRD